VRNRQLNIDNYDDLIRYFWACEVEADNPTADAIEWPLMEYCTTGLSKKYRADQLNTFKKK